MQLSWHGGRGTLACVTEDSTVILNESVMHAYMKGDLSVSVSVFICYMLWALNVSAYVLSLSVTTFSWRVFVFS